MDEEKIHLKKIKKIEFVWLKPNFTLHTFEEIKSIEEKSKTKEVGLGLKIIFNDDEFCKVTLFGPNYSIHIANEISKVLHLSVDVHSSVHISEGNMPEYCACQKLNDGRYIFKKFVSANSIQSLAEDALTRSL